MTTWSILQNQVTKNELGDSLVEVKSPPPSNGTMMTLIILNLLLLLIYLGANFPEWSALSFNRNFPDLEIHNSNNQKTHVSNISHKVCMCAQVSGCW